MTRPLALALTFALPLTLPAAPPDRKELKPGLVVTAADVHRLDPTVTTTNPAATRWAGYLLTVADGEYTFGGPVEGGTLALSVNGRDVPLGKPVRLPAGVSPFAAEFRPTGANVLVELRWQGPQIRPEPIPYYAFGHLPSERPAKFAADTAVDRGRFLYEELACGKCHPVAGLVDRTGPDLTKIGDRAYPGWLDAWLADPAKLRPHTTMPAMFADTPAGKAERYAVASYLSSLDGPITEGKNPGFSNDYRKRVANGEKLFTTTGCAACHGPQLAATLKPTEDDDNPPPAARGNFHDLSPTGAQWVYSLGATGSKTTASQWTRYVLDPLTTNPHGRMPKMGLTGEEARDLGLHLARLTDDRVPKSLPNPPGDPPAGKTWREFAKSLVSSKGCVNCHTVKKEVSTLKVPTITTATAGCLSDKPDPARHPVYKLSAADRSALSAFVKSNPNKPSPAPAHAARASLTRFGCLNCHKRDGDGGIGTLLSDQMKALENAQNADDVQPPPLTGIGQKATPNWLNSVLLESGRARPWMTLRMPQYGKDNVGHLPASLAALDAAGPVPPTKSEFAAATLEAGRTLAGKNGLGCIGCHDISGVAAGGTRGPDLALTEKRVRFDWYGRWMHNPQRLVPGTKMPTNFNDGKSVLPKILDGDGDKQLRALWAYFALGPGLPLPVGLEPPKGVVLSVGERPELLRTFLPDAGSRAIAVGYPGGVSVAFDAHAARLAFAWEGNFLDASPVWNNRGGSPAKLLGPKFAVAPPGQPWATTESRTPPDFAGRADDYAYGATVPDNKLYKGPMKVSFAGYALDAGGNPTFEYAVDGLQVEDTPAAAKRAVATGLTRRFSVTVPADKTAWYLGGVAIEMPRAVGPDGKKLVPSDPDAEVPAVGTQVVLPQPDGRATVLHLTTGPAGTVWRFVKLGDRWQAVLRLPAAKSDLSLTTWALPRDTDELLAAVK